MSIFVTDTAKTKAKATLQKRRNLFGLGVTSLIAACADGEGAGGGGGKTPADPVVTIPTVPAKLTATEQLLAETSIEKLAPVAVDSDHISASPLASPNRKHHSDMSVLNDLVVTINEASDLVQADFEMTFKNGNHAENSANPDDPVNHFASVYQLKEGTNDLVVTSADFGGLDGNNITGAIYIVWDIGSRGATTFDDTTDNNFLKVIGSPTRPIGQYAPEFLHIGGDDNGGAQYDMVFGGYDGDDHDFLYILWDVAKYAGASAADQSIDVRSTTAAVPHGLLQIVNFSAGTTNIAKHYPEFFHIGGNTGETKYDMVIRAVGDGTSTNRDRIHILWDINQYYKGMNNRPETVTLGNGTTSGLLINERDSGSSNIAKHAPEFLQIGGVVADSKEQHDMVIRSEHTAGDNIYILWDVGAYFGVTSIGSRSDKYVYLKSGTNAGGIHSRANKGLLEITGVAGENIVKHSPDFAQIGGDDSGDAQYDMVIRSEDDTGVIYILWDVAAYYDDITVGNEPSSTFDVDLNNDSTITNGLLRIFGEAGKKIGEYSPEFLQIGGTDTQNDMIIKSNDGSTIYILWDVAAYYSNITIGDINKLTFAVDLGSGSIPNGSLKITGENVGEYSPEFLQIGGVDASSVAQQDMIIRSDTAIYVLWDVAAYYSTASTPINLSTNDGITKGLLKITGTTASEKIGQSAPDILKINNNGDYDMIIKSDANMYVLWDFTKDYSATTPASVSLTTAASTGNGLLTISGTTADANILKVTGSTTGTDGSFLDIDSKGINDIVFTDGGNTFILFGEKIAYRDVNEKAVSHTVNLTAINAIDFGGSAGFFTADKVTTVAADAIGYRYANDDLDTLADVQGNPPSFSLSDADAVWDIA